MVAVFMADMPTIEIVDGMVHCVTKERECYWRISTFRAFVEQGRRELDAFDREARRVIPLKLSDDDHYAAQACTGISPSVSRSIATARFRLGFSLPLMSLWKLLRS